MIEKERLPLRLSEEEEKKLFDLYYNQGNQEAKEKLINHNLRLILTVIRRKFFGYLDTFEEDDMFQVGAEGLAKGIERFDPSLDYKLSTYVCSYIQGYIQRYVERYNMKMPKSCIISLESQPVGENEQGEETFLSDYLASDEDVAENVVKKVSAKDVIRIIREYIYSHYSKRNALMFEYRYGLIDGHIKTLNETAEKFDITRERVRQLCDKMLKNIKHALLAAGYARENQKGEIVRDI